MKIKLFVIFFILFTLIAISGCSLLQKRISKEEAALDKKIGQMIIVGFRGLKAGDNESIVNAIKNHYIGGVILFDYDGLTKTSLRNIQSPEQVKELTTQLQSYAPIPLFIAIDQEGGKIRRLKEKYGFPPTVSAQYLGQTNDTSLTYNETKKMAETLSQMGINLNFAPVVDLNINPLNPIIAKYERSFSDSPEIVTSHAKEFIKAHHEYGILCTLKHFPGHGSSKDDSHFGLTDITDTWTQIELKPYENIIKSGNMDAVMTAHIFNSKLDPKYPATLSNPILTGLLRKSLGYDGVIISDDMQMKAITNYYGFETAIQLTLEAGTDIILIANNAEIYEEDIALRAINIIKQLVKDKKISVERINESYRRIQNLKKKLIVKNDTKIVQADKFITFPNLSN